METGQTLECYLASTIALTIDKTLKGSYWLNEEVLRSVVDKKKKVSLISEVD